MRYVSAFCLFVLLSGLAAVAQVLPASNGSCSVTASGLESCDWMSGVRRRRTSAKTHLVEDERAVAGAAVSLALPREPA